MHFLNTQLLEFQLFTTPCIMAENFLRRNKEKVKHILSRNFFLHKSIYLFYNLWHRRGLQKHYSGGVKIRVFNLGKNNVFFADKGCFLDNTFVEVRGNNNIIKLGKNVKMREKCHLYIIGNNCKIDIGDNVTMTSYIHLEVNEDNQYILIGEDCMFSNHIICRTNDSHPIYKKDTLERINPPKSIVIGNHVWIAAGVSILKGVHIKDGSIIGLNSIVTHDIPSYSLAVGAPAKVVKEDVEWTRKLKST